MACIAAVESELIAGCIGVIIIFLCVRSGGSRCPEEVTYVCAKPSTIICSVAGIISCNRIVILVGLESVRHRACSGVAPEVTLGELHLLVCAYRELTCEEVRIGCRSWSWCCCRCGKDRTDEIIIIFVSVINNLCFDIKIPASVRFIISRRPIGPFGEKTVDFVIVVIVIAC